MKIDNQQEFGKLVSNSLKLILGVSIAVSSFIGISFFFILVNTLINF